MTAAQFNLLLEAMAPKDKAAGQRVRRPAGRGFKRMDRSRLEQIKAKLRENRGR